MASAVRRVFSGGAGIHGFDLHIAEGQVHALVGLNGAGKTTLMRLLLGMLQPDAGTVWIDGSAPRDAAAETWTRVGHLVDHPLAYPELDVRTNLMIAARLRGVPRTSIDVMVDAALAELHLERYASVRTRVLSSGNRQRLGLAAALQHGPEILVLDEPTNTLDPAGVILLREAIRRRADGGAGVLVSSHHLDEVARIADFITVINHGRMIGTIDSQGVDIERSFFALVHADDEGRLA